VFTGYDQRGADTAAMADTAPTPTTRRPVAALRAMMVRRRVRAMMAAHPLTDTERGQLERARAGDLRGLRTRDDRGNWATL
jgi:hypothetical protein